MVRPEENGVTLMPPGFAGRMTAVAGGEAESFARTACYQVTGRELDPSRLQRFRIQKSYREAVVDLGGISLKIGAVSGLSQAVSVLGEVFSGVRQLDLLEVMACPEGCVNGGGQPLRTGTQLVRARTRAIYDQDNQAVIRAAHGNPGALLLGDRYRENGGMDRGESQLMRSFTDKGREGHEH